MYATISPFDAAGQKGASLSDIRVAGGVSLKFAMRGHRTSLIDLREEDGYKVRCPKRREGIEAAIINTGGGIAGGDHVKFSAELEDGASATVAAPAAERVYGALNGATAQLDIDLTLGADAKLHWLPQETILFDRARLKRALTVEMDASAELLIAETVILGRTAMGETVASGLFEDRWRIRQGGTLVFAETVRLGGGIADLMQRPAIAGGAHVISTILLVAPQAKDRLEAVRSALDGVSCEAGASSWNDLLVVRALGHDNRAIRQMLQRVLPILWQTALPRSWSV